MFNPDLGRFVTRHSARGMPFEVWERPMPRIHDEYLNCSVYLYRSRHEAEEGINIGGSGFIMSYPAKSFPHPEGFGYLVTNKHVVEGGARCMRVNMKNGGFDIFEFPEDYWTLAPDDDLAVCMIPLLHPDRFRIGTVGIDRLVTQKIVSERNFGPGDEVVLIGRFVNMEGKQQNLPTVRFGHISQMPIEPIEYEGKFQESFLCEVKSIGGFSGSPVFVAPIAAAFVDDMKKEHKQAYLLGVDWCHMQSHEHPIDDYGHEIQSMRVCVNTGMMGVVPAWKLRELLDCETETEKRKFMEEREHQRRKASGAKPDSALGAKPSPRANGENPNHQEDFTRLVGAAARTLGPKD